MEIDYKAFEVLFYLYYPFAHHNDNGDGYTNHNDFVLESDCRTTSNFADRVESN